MDKITCEIHFRESEEGEYNKEKSPWLQYLCDVTVYVGDKRYGIALSTPKESFDSETVSKEQMQGIVQITGRTIRNHFTK